MNPSVTRLIFIMRRKCEQEEKKRLLTFYSPRIWSDFKRLWQRESAHTHWPCVRMWPLHFSRLSGVELLFRRAPWCYSCQASLDEVPVCSRVEMRRDEMLQWPHRNSALCLRFIPEVWDESGMRVASRNDWSINLLRSSPSKRKWNAS